MELHMGSHTVPATRHKWTHPALTPYKLVLDLPTPERWKAELTSVTCYIPRWFTRQQTVTHLSTNRTLSATQRGSRQLVTDLLRRNWCNVSWFLLATTPRYCSISVTSVVISSWSWWREARASAFSTVFSCRLRFLYRVLEPCSWSYVIYTHKWNSEKNIIFDCSGTCWNYK